MKRVVAWLASALLLIGTLFGAALPAAAAPPTETWRAAAGGDAAAVDLAVAGLTLANARLATSQAGTGSQLSPRSSAQSANLGAAVAGLPLAIVGSGQTAPPDHTDPTTATLLGADAVGIGVQTLTTSNLARWSGDATCLPTPVLADSRTSTAGLSVNPLGLADLLTTGVVATEGRTTLASTGGNGLNKAVQSTAVGRLAGASVLGGAVQVAVDGDSTLTARASGTTGGADVTYTPGTVRVTVANVTSVLAAGATRTIDLGLVGRVVITANTPTRTTNGAGTSAEASVSVVTLQIRAGLAVAPLATATVGLVPLRASAVAPAGGIDCPAPKPATPVVTAPADGSLADDATPTFRGTGTAGATVDLTVDGTTTPAATTVDADGRWAVTPTTVLTNASHSVSVTQTLLGATSDRSNVNTFRVDTVAPGAPVLVDPAEGLLTTDDTPTFTGTAEAGSSVEVLLDGQPIGRTDASGSGAVSFTPTTPLDDGTYTATLRATDAAGNTSVRSNAHTFTIDSTAPAVPVVTTPADGSTGTDTTPTYRGTAPANVEVQVFVDGAPLGTTRSDGSGAWTLASTAALDEGEHTVAALTRDAAGNASARSATNTFVVDLTAPEAPVIDEPADGSSTDDTTPELSGTGEPGATVTLRVDGDLVGTAEVDEDGGWSLQLTDALAPGTRTVTAVQADAAGNRSGSASSTFSVDTTAPAAPVITGPADGATFTGPAVTVTGTGEPFARVTVTETGGGASYGPVTVSSSGSWSVVLDDLVDGFYSVRARQVDAAGNTSPASDERTFVVDSEAPDAPVITVPLDGTVTTDRTPTISGTGEPGATLTLTDQRGTEYPVVEVTEFGTWSLVPAADLADGTYAVTATQTDGTQASASSSTVSFTVDGTAPSAPVVVAPENGSATADTTPTVSGTGEAGAAVVVTLGGTALPATTVAGDGTWSVTSTAALPPGPVTASAVQTDPAGNSSPPGTSTFVVDVAAPAPPVIQAPAEGSSTTDATPTVRGTGEAGATVTVTVDGIAAGEALVLEDQTWSLETLRVLDTGGHTVRAVQTDAAGNPSGADSTRFRVDLEAPDRPVVTAPVQGAVLATATPVLRGTGEPGAVVTATVDGSPVGTATVDEDGRWSVQVTDALSATSHVASAVQRDPAGNVSQPAAGVDFSVDVVAPGLPTVVQPGAGTTTRDTTPTVSGAAEAGSTVRVYVDGDLVATTTAGPTGYSVPTSELADGSHTVVVTATDAAGNVSPESAPVTFAVDATAPSVPVVETPAAGATTTATPPISGRADPGSTVTVTLDEDALAPVVADRDGVWTLTPPAPLGEGEHTVTATAADAAGNVSAPSPVVGFVVDLTAPAVPVVAAPADGSATNDTTPTVTGTAEAGATVEVTVDGRVVGSTEAGAGGGWTLTLADPLAAGRHTVAARALDAVGNASALSAVNTFTVDLTAPGAPVVTAPVAGSTVDDATPTVAGTGEAGSTVTVTVDGELVGTAPVDGGGGWTLPLTDALDDGPHTVLAVQTDTAGNSSPATTVSFTVDTEDPAAPVITAPSGEPVLIGPDVVVTGTGESGSTVVVTTGAGTAYGPVPVTAGAWTVTLPGLADGAYVVTAIQTDAGGNASPASDPARFTVDGTAPAAPVVTTPPAGSVTADTTPVVAGTGEASSTVTVRVDGVAVGTAVVADGGAWSLTLTDALLDGPHVVTASQRDAGGSTSAQSSPVSFTVDTGQPAAPVITAPADGSSVGTATPTVTGTGEAGATVRVSVDDQLVGTALVDGNGRWVLALTDPLDEGPHEVFATQADAAGNVSPGVTSTFTVDLQAPAAPVITTPPNGSTTRDTTPRLAGTAEPGAEVRVRLDTTDLDAVTADDQGRWELQVEDALDDGVRTVRATQVDRAGNVSSAATSTFTVDASAPAAPVVLDPADGSVTADATPAFSGTAEPGARVEVRVDGTPVGTTTATQGGTWTLQPGDDVDPLDQGEHEVLAVATDGAGNPSVPSAVNTFTVDTAAPDAPVITAPADGSTTRDRTPLVTGTGEAGAVVTVTVDGTRVGTAAVDEDGRWSLQLTEPLDDGARVIAAGQADEAGNTSDAASVTVTVDGTADAAPVITVPAEDALLTDGDVTVSGTGVDGSRVTVTVGGRTYGPVTVSGGVWSLVVPDLADGPYTATAVQVDPAGNRSAPSTAVPFVVDTAAAPPVITAPADGSRTGDTTPTVSGRGELGATVTVLVDDVVVGTAEVDGDGRWSLELTTPLAEGPHTAEASQVDAAGNTSAVASSTFAVDLTAPAAPVVTEPADGSSTTDTTPVLRGTAEPGASVEVGVDGEVVGTVTATRAGTWSLTLDEPLAPGEHTVGATAVDGAGNRSEPAEEHTFTVVATAATPVITSPVPGTPVTSPVQVCGTGEPGAEIALRDADGTVLGRATVGTDGRWCVTVTLPPGAQTVEAVQTGPDGDTAVSAEVVITVGTGSGDGGNGNGGNGGTGNGNGGTGNGGVGNGNGGSGNGGVGNGGVGNGSAGNGGTGSGPLASTGGPGTLIPLAGLLLVLGGGALLLVRRRRQG